MSVLGAISEWDGDADVHEVSRHEKSFEKLIRALNMEQLDNFLVSHSHLTIQASGKRSEIGSEASLLATKSFEGAIRIGARHGWN